MEVPRVSQAQALVDVLGDLVLVVVAVLGGRSACCPTGFLFTLKAAVVGAGAGASDGF